VNKRVRTVLLVMVLILVAMALAGCGAPQGNISLDKPQGAWQQFIVFPLAHSLVFLNDVIHSVNIPFSWGWAIIVFTIIVKLVTLPLTLKQLQSTKATQELQPKLTELQQKYAKDKQKLSEEQMKLYKEAGVNPLGGCLPLLIQMPILFGLYQALYVLANPSVGKLANARFFWIPDLSFPDLTTGMSWMSKAFSGGQYGLLAAYISLPLIMIASQLILQKMSTPAPAASTAGNKANDQTRMMGQMMMFMPIMFGYITLGLPSGLTLYWTVSNILSIVQQYFITGWGSLGSWIPALKPRSAVLVETVEDPDSYSSPDKPKRRRRRK
jgi:YidC/Oxa1 family membrane protein insertase